jgi:hypothetical protein
VRIIAIDPGNTMSAWCELVDGKPVMCGKFENKPLVGFLRHGDAGQATDPLAIEMIASYGMAVGREVFDTCLWIGRFMEAWEARGGTVKLIFRKDVKLYHCGTVRATDANVRASLLDRYGPGREIAVGTKRAPGPLYGIKGDEWSALAVALTLEAQLKPDLHAMERVVAPLVQTPMRIVPNGEPF